MLTKQDLVQHEKHLKLNESGDFIRLWRWIRDNWFSYSYMQHTSIKTHWPKYNQFM